MIADDGGFAATHGERTALAWRRTGATFFVMTLALMKLVIARSEFAVMVLAAAGLSAAVASAVLGRRRQTGQQPERNSAMFQASMTTAVALVAVAGILDLVLAWTR